MEPVPSALITIRQIMKFYELCQEPVRQRYQLSRMELTIISFLHNNPGHDTVGEISYMRMLSKGNVSRSADSLIKKGLMERIPDQVDRRWVHLRLRETAAPIVEAVEQASLIFAREAFAGFTREDMDAFRDLNHRLAHNVSLSMERSSYSDGE